MNMRQRVPNKRIRKKLRLTIGWPTPRALGFCRVCGRRLHRGDFTITNYCDRCGTTYYESWVSWGRP